MKGFQRKLYSGVRLQLQIFSLKGKWKGDALNNNMTAQIYHNRSIGKTSHEKPTNRKVTLQVNVS